MYLVSVACTHPFTDLCKPKASDWLSFSGLFLTLKEGGTSLSCMCSTLTLCFDRSLRSPFHCALTDPCVPPFYCALTDPCGPCAGRAQHRGWQPWQRNCAECAARHAWGRGQGQLLKRGRDRGLQRWPGHGHLPLHPQVGAWGHNHRQACFLNLLGLVSALLRLGHARLPQALKLKCRMTWKLIWHGGFSCCLAQGFFLSSSTGVLFVVLRPARGPPAFEPTLLLACDPTNCSGCGDYLVHVSPLGSRCPASCSALRDPEGGERWMSLLDKGLLKNTCPAVVLAEGCCKRRMLRHGATARSAFWGTERL